MATFDSFFPPWAARCRPSIILSYHTKYPHVHLHLSEGCFGWRLTGRIDTFLSGVYGPFILKPTHTITLSLSSFLYVGNQTPTHFRPPCLGVVSIANFFRYHAPITYSRVSDCLSGSEECEWHFKPKYSVRCSSCQNRMPSLLRT